MSKTLIEKKLNKIGKGMMIGGAWITLGSIFLPIGFIFWIFGVAAIINGFQED